MNDSIESVDLKDIEVSGEKPKRESIKIEENLPQVRADSQENLLLKEEENQNS